MFQEAQAQSIQVQSAVKRGQSGLQGTIQGSLHLGRSGIINKRICTQCSQYNCTVIFKNKCRLGVFFFSALPFFNSLFFISDVQLLMLLRTAEMESGGMGGNCKRSYFH